ncbi:MAG: molybdate ABC transporter substrate-binding protein [Anaerolineaceae bacterium]|nr:molybdate ABC transporter substrate-binding protein [Anaerolineaceae bacterium]
MKIIKNFLYIILIFLSSCQVFPNLSLNPTSTTSVEEITIAAAADLQFAFTDIVNLYEQQTGRKVTLVFGSTGQLVQQIENGAPFDLVAAANISYIERLVAGGLAIPESAALYGRGRIVLAVNKQSGIQAVSLEDLLSDNILHIAMANPDHAPYGLAAKQALESLGLWEQLQPKLVYGENVRQALQFIQTGDAEVGIISLSVANVPEITWTIIDESLHIPLDQALAILTTSKNPEMAGDFIAFINGEIGRPIMRQYGFLLPDEIRLLSNQQNTPQP